VSARRDFVDHCGRILWGLRRSCDWCPHDITRYLPNLYLSFYEALCVLLVVLTLLGFEVSENTCVRLLERVHCFGSLATFREQGSRVTEILGVLPVCPWGSKCQRTLVPT
jgi:hypothetical protein